MLGLDQDLGERDRGREGGVSPTPIICVGGEVCYHPG